MKMRNGSPQKKKRTPEEEYTRRAEWMKFRYFLMIFGLILLGAALFAAFFASLADGLGARAGASAPVPPVLAAEEAGEGVGRDWFRPEEAEIVWEEPARDIASPDWNLNTSLVGWGGRKMEVWEMDLYSRIVYLEFWGTSQECTEAGADSILRLWELGEYGDTIGELLMAQYAPGYYVYSPMAYVWDWEYDAEGLADICALCEERFFNGPEWVAPYFRLWYYHPWATPCYCLDGVYFSAPAVTIGR